MRAMIGLPAAPNYPRTLFLHYARSTATAHGRRATNLERASALRPENRTTFRWRSEDHSTRFCLEPGADQGR
eukprot:5395612-Pyramimonas_sp.AAC.1